MSCIDSPKEQSRKLSRVHKKNVPDAFDHVV